MLNSILILIWIGLIATMQIVIDLICISRHNKNSSITAGILTVKFVNTRSKHKNTKKKSGYCFGEVVNKIIRPIRVQSSTRELVCLKGMGFLRFDVNNTGYG